MAGRRASDTEPLPVGAKASRTLSAETPWAARSQAPLAEPVAAVIRVIHSVGHRGVDAVGRQAEVPVDGPDTPPWGPRPAPGS